MGGVWDANRPPLGDRVARMSASPSSPRANGSAKHVWILLGDESATGWVPGLLRRWQRRQDGWWAEVAAVDEDGNFGVWLLHQRWIRPDAPTAGS